MKRTVLDASVVLKWFLPDEEYGGKSLEFLDRYMANDLEIVVPSLLEYELVNGLVIAGRRGRLKEAKVLSAVEGFLKLGLTFSSLSALYIRILHFCGIYKCSVYDASYLALAEGEGILLVTADERLYKGVKKDLAWVKWIGDI